MQFARPETMDEALSLLAEGDWDILAGGTDYYPGLRDQAPRKPVLDITSLDGIRGIRQDADGYHIGALTTWSQVIAAQLPQAFDSLKQAGREVGSVQIQNRATVAGNLCNASPAADGVPPLLTLDAVVIVAGPSGERRVPLPDFILGNRRTGLRPGELVTAVFIPASATFGTSRFLKLGTRRYLVISISMVAARIVLDEAGHIREASVAVGACSEVAQRLPGVEAGLVGLGRGQDVTSAIPAQALSPLSPIDDVRAPASYRLEAARELVCRAVAAAMEEEG